MNYFNQYHPTKIMILVGLLIGVLLIVPACSDSSPDVSSATQSSGTIQTKSQTVDAANFVAPLKAYLDAYPQCFVIHDRLTALPGEIQVVGEKSANGIMSPPLLSRFLEENPILAELERNGFISLTSEQREGKSIFSDERVVRYFITIDVTELGKSFYRSLTQDNSVGKRAVFCYGTKELIDIGNVQEQQDTSGKRFAFIDYTYRVSHIETWAQTPEFEKVLAGIAHNLNSLRDMQHDKALFIMNSRNEWVNEYLYQE
ncbi:MAG: hypothetical protein LBS40_03490 [Burkholderiales bacterium]|jgi:hypothetical protein|nr:hypothetical protein [Burkholderiales bacterium]